MQRNAEKIERKRSSSQLCNPSANLCAAASTLPLFKQSLSFHAASTTRRLGALTVCEVVDFSKLAQQEPARLQRTVWQCLLTGVQFCVIL